MADRDLIDVAGLSDLVDDAMDDGYWFVAVDLDTGVTYRERISGGSVLALVRRPVVEDDDAA